MSLLPATTVERVEQHVLRLLSAWREETAYLSSSTAITEHSAYQELIALGTSALPFLFRDLDKTGDGHLSKALTAITGVRPITVEDRGQVQKAAEYWLRWAKENGHQ